MSRLNGVRMSLIALCFLHCVSSAVMPLFAQDRSDWRWYFGNKLGLDFNQLPPQELSDGQTRHEEGSAVLSDSADGHLMLYSDGNTVWDRSHAVIATNLNPKFASSTQSALFLRQPGSNNIVHLFSTPATGSGTAVHVVLDMNLRGGLGDTVLWEPRFSVQAVCEKIAAVNVKNSSDWWVVFRGCGVNSSAFLSYRLSSSGLVSTPVRSAVGMVIKTPIETSPCIGQLKFSPDGKRLLSANELADIELFDFDRSTGIVSNPRTIVSDSRHMAYGAEFSASGRYIYFGRQTIQIDSVIRFDLQAADIQASRRAISGSSTTVGQMLLARDGKIYVAQGSQKYLGAIVNPDSDSARYDEQAFELKGYNSIPFIGLPNVPRRVSDLPLDLPSKLEAPSYVCNGSKIPLRIVSYLGDSLRVYLKFSNGRDTLIEAKGPEINIEMKYTGNVWTYCTVIVRGIGSVYSTKMDTLRASVNPWYDCCRDVVRNGGFYAIAAGGQCFPVEYSTDMDLRASQNAPCVYTIDKPGQIACEYRASYGNSHWNGESRSSPINTFILYGETSPNQLQRAWYETLPVRPHTRYRISSWVRNVEADPRFDTAGVSLHFELALKHLGGRTIVKAVDGVRYSDGWVELAGDFVTGEDVEVELSLSILCTTPHSRSYGFALDDISCLSISPMQIDAGQDLWTCRGVSTTLKSSFVQQAAVQWSPPKGLSDPRALQPIVTLDSTQRYILVALDSVGCEKRDTVTVHVFQPEHPRVYANRTELCSGDSVLIYSDSLSFYYGSSNVEWNDHSKGDSLIVRQAGKYYVHGIDGNGCAFSSDTIEVLDQLPIYTTLHLPSDRMLRSGEVTQLRMYLDTALPYLDGADYVLHLRVRTGVLIDSRAKVVQQNDDWTILEYQGQINGTYLTNAPKFLALFSEEMSTQIVVDSFAILNSCSVIVQADSMSVDVSTCWVKGGLRTTTPLQVLSLAPQPADAALHLVLQNQADEEIQADLVDLLGHKLSYKLELGSLPASLAQQQSVEIDTHSLPSGWYTIRLQSAGHLLCLPFYVVH